MRARATALGLERRGCDSASQFHTTRQTKSFKKALRHDTKILMKRVTQLLRILLVALVFPLLANAAESTAKIRALIVTGGHDFERQPFFQMFDDNPNLSYVAVEHPRAQEWFKPEPAVKYDVIVLYDLHQEISETAKMDFLGRLKEGKGLLVIHHAIANYQTWPEYAKIIGARYYLQKTNVNGVEKPRSAYKHDVHFKVEPTGNHPVTAGLKAFD